MSTNLPGFPNEILAVIGSYLADDKEALCSFSLCCKHFAAVATPILYRSVGTLCLPTLASDDLLLSQIIGQSPACFVREITVSADDEEEIVRDSLKGALFNIEHNVSHHTLDLFSYTSETYGVFDLCQGYFPTSLSIRHLDLQCPVSVPSTVGFHSAPTSPVLGLLSHTMECIKLDWTQADNPPSYAVIANLIVLLPSRLQSLKSLELNIPPVVSDDDVVAIQRVFDCENIKFPYLTRFVFGEIYGDISLSSFFRRHPAITTLGYCGISNDGLLVDLIRSKNVLTNVHSFIGDAGSALIVATALSTKLTVLTLTGPTAVILFRDVACQVLRMCYWLRELRLPSPTGYNSHELQTISDYVPGLAVLRITFLDCESGPSSSESVVEDYAFNFYSTILLCFTSLTEVEVTLCTPYSRRVRLQHRKSFLRALHTYRNSSTRCLSVVIRTSLPDKTLFALEVVDSSAQSTT
ncbi:hypothetical protein F5879DRAFT_988122 [Lentinula edodes]|nr:hypothetical protein F5879DRAFT_988122 [Lentinula edodes]